MNLYVLVIIDRMASRGTADWYFDDHAHFLRARKLAQELQIFITDRIEFVADVGDFRHWIAENRKEQQAG